MALVEAVSFDLDGMIGQSEAIWDAARWELAAEHGAQPPPGATEAMTGTNSLESSRYLWRAAGLPLALEPTAPPTSSSTLSPS
jgi:beta-phosphoglucomutase-like phosphatase (HAD superfamily)